MQINDMDIRRTGGGFRAPGQLLVSMVYDPGLRFTVRTTATNQPIMKTLVCVNAAVTAHDGLVSDICVAVKEFLAQEWLAKVDR